MHSRFSTTRYEWGVLDFALADHIVMQNDAVRGLRHTARHQLVGDLIVEAPIWKIVFGI